MTPTDIRRIVAEAVKKGCKVKVEPDGTVEITPPNVAEQARDDLSNIDFCGGEDPTTVYRYYSADGSLLYVGISREWHNRDKALFKSSEWRAAAAYAMTEEFPMRRIALAAEAEAIKYERPKFNCTVGEARVLRRQEESRWRRNGRLRGDNRFWFDAAIRGAEYTCPEAIGEGDEAPFA